MRSFRDRSAPVLPAPHEWNRHAVLVRSVAHRDSRKAALSGVRNERHAGELARAGEGFSSSQVAPTPVHDFVVPVKKRTKPRQKPLAAIDIRLISLVDRGFTLMFHLT